MVRDTCVWQRRPDAGSFRSAGTVKAAQGSDPLHCSWPGMLRYRAEAEAGQAESK